MRALCVFVAAALRCGAAPSFRSAASAATLPAAAAALPSFATWSANRVYANASEAARRASVFASNMRRAAAHNALGASSYTLGASPFADLMPAEWVASLHRASASPLPLLASSAAAAPAPRAPPSVDWRASGCVGPVRNQGQCGADWAIAAVEAVEWACCLAAGGGAGNATRLSVQEELDCVGGGQGCGGGTLARAWAYARAAGGLCTERAYPYTGAAGPCRASRCPHECRVTGVVSVPPDAPDALLAALAGRPVVVGVDAGSDAFMLYAGGVISGASCGDAVDHYVVAVGYDAAAAPLPFVRVANSWGADWGEGGYARIALGGAGAGTCGIYAAPAYVTVARHAASDAAAA